MGPFLKALRLDMEKPMEGHPNIVFTLESKGTATEVSWTMAGPYPYINRVSARFLAWIRSSAALSLMVFQT